MRLFGTISRRSETQNGLQLEGTADGRETRRRSRKTLSLPTCFESPGGTTRNSQGRQPLEQADEHERAPEGAAL